MSFKQAIEDEISCNHKIVTVFFSEKDQSNLSFEQDEIMAQFGNQKAETDSHNLAAGITIEKVFQKQKI